MSSAVYTNAKYLMLANTLQWAAPAVVFRAMLVTDSYVYNSAHVSVSDVIGYEVSSSSYARVDVTSRTVTRDIGGDTASARAASVVFPVLYNCTPSGCLIYRRGGANDDTPSDDYLVCFVDFPAVATVQADFIVEFGAAGVFSIRSA